MATKTWIGSARSNWDGEVATRISTSSATAKKAGRVFGGTIDRTASQSDERAWTYWRELVGSGGEPVAGAVVAERADPDEMIEVLVCLRQKKSAIGDGAIDRTDLALLRSFTDHFALSIEDVLPNGGLVVMTGPLAAFETAFKVELHRHRFENGASYRGCIDPVRLPLGIAGIVVGVFGLDNRRLPWRRDPKEAYGEADLNPAPRPVIFANPPARAYNPQQPWAA